MSAGILRTTNERIVDANGEAVLLRGVSHHVSNQVAYSS